MHNILSHYTFAYLGLFNKFSKHDDAIFGVVVNGMEEGYDCIGSYKGEKSGNLCQHHCKSMLVQELMSGKYSYIVEYNYLVDVLEHIDLHDYICHWLHN